MPETCENWFTLVNSSIYYARQTREIYQVLPYAPRSRWNPLSKTALSKCSFIWYSVPVNIWNGHKIQK